MLYVFMCFTSSFILNSRVILMICLFCSFFFFKQKTAYEMRISDWSSDVCSSDLLRPLFQYIERLPAEPRPNTPLGKIFALHQQFIKPAVGAPAVQIGRASCRERVCQYV